MTTDCQSVPAVQLDAALATHIYDAECALHAAHQSGVGPWVKAAADRLHTLLVQAAFVPPAPAASSKT